jgi:hypothetical protein
VRIPVAYEDVENDPINDIAHRFKSAQCANDGSYRLKVGPTILGILVPGGDIEDLSYLLHVHPSVPWRTVETTHHEGLADG